MESQKEKEEERKRSLASITPLHCTCRKSVGNCIKKKPKEYILLLIQGLGNLLEDRSGINVYFLGSASKTLFHVHLINLLNCVLGFCWLVYIYIYLVSLAY